MDTSASKKDIISQLQKQILALQGFEPNIAGKGNGVGLGAIESAFANGVFPKGAIHEFISGLPEHAAATDGFIAGLMASLMQSGHACLWISTARRLFPPALKAFKVPPERVIFVDLKRERDVLWATEEALKCEGFATVVAEIQELNFAQSRRLQLAVEKSRVTGFILRTNPQKIVATACTARWKIMPLPSEPEEGMPGLGCPRWNVELLKVRNGNPGNWKVEWQAGSFAIIQEKEPEAIVQLHALKAG